MISKSRVTSLVKAYPQPSKSHTETVCCAGIDDHGTWRRLYPIRFRQLADDQAFARWNIVDFSYSTPSHDQRRESCRVHEESISIDGKVVSKKEKQAIIDPAVVASEKSASAMGASLALIRPTNVNLTWKEKTLSELADAREAFEKQARQATMFDKALDTLEPCRFTFNMSYEDEGGPHTKTCADWETSAAFFKLDREYGSQEALEHLRSTYCEKYVRTGLVFALGNIAKRPHVWQLLGIFPSEPSSQFLMKL
jgi:hypothetical protein